MASHFSANQYDREYRPRQLGNWEVPKIHPVRPDTRKGCTTVIANDRGHLLPCVKRPNTNPWGDFKNTWQLPDKISRDFANQITSPKSGGSRWKRPWMCKQARGCPKEAFDQSLCIKGANHEILGGSSEEPKVANLEYTPGDITKPHDRHSSRSLLVEKRNRERLEKAQKLEPNELYTEKHDCTDELALLQEKKDHEKEDTPHVLGTGVPDNLEAIEATAPLEGTNPIEAMQEQQMGFPKMRIERPVAEKPTERNVPQPIVPAYCNFLTARKMAQENLEHQPLPDAIMDLAFRKLQAQGGINPGLALDVTPITTGIGCKNYKAGPTQCTKLRVYRPKTCGVVPPILDKNYPRPMTSFITKEKMGAMDLAIGWDYRPRDPREEPKKPKHIDGSNGSAAPAVFTLVKTPTPPTPSMDPGHITHSEGVFNNTLGEVDFFDRDVVRQHKEHLKKYEMGRKCGCGNKKKDSLPTPENISAARPRTSSGHGSVNGVKSPKLSNQNSEEERKRSKSTSNLSELARINENESIYGYHIHGRHSCRKTEEKLFCPKHEKGHRLYYSASNGRSKSQEPLQPATPKLTQQVEPMKKVPSGLKTSRMCQQENQESYLRELKKDEYKTAFKAGVPKSNSSGTCTSFDSGIDSCSNSSSVPCIKTALKVPKPRQPFARKNYSISTLNPPFSCFKGGAGQGGYPEHWRLASVYQHAYKPIETRKRTLLQTVFQ